MRTPVLLMILDGWGYAPAWGGNAIALARCSFIDELWRNCPHTLLAASGQAVGLPGHEMGNSEVGHLNIGAGTIISQDVIKINHAIADRSFFSNPVLIQAMDRVKDGSRNLHLMGILSDGGIHGHINHLLALLYLAKMRGLRNIYLHVFTDGRDTSPTSAQTFIYRINNAIAKLGVGQIATISGRYYAMDRDKHWSRINLVYSAMTEGVGERSKSALGTVAQAYTKGETDEFIKPTIVLTNNVPPPPVRDGDSVIFWNFRSDRARELTQAFLKPSINDYRRRVFLKDLFFVSMIPYGYEADIGVKPNIAFEPDKIKQTLASVLSQHHLTQLHIAETEKYAHVTFFFNGTVERPYPGEDRILVPSPKVATFDLAPEMSAAAITANVIKALERRKYDFIVMNYANADMVGHTGNIDATKRACSFVDLQVRRAVGKAHDAGYTVFITGDHGNAEQMIDPMTNEPDTAHTKNPVPLIFVPSQDNATVFRLNDGGKLSDITPTILNLMAITPPAEIKGHNLLIKAESYARV
jgi:2,3-bisphosphoglycerate-independent phosphoglycerate mutase